MPNPVKLYVYDLSNGLARQRLLLRLGNVDGLGSRCFGLGDVDSLGRGRLDLGGGLQVWSCCGK